MKNIGVKYIGDYVIFFDEGFTSSNDFIIRTVKKFNYPEVILIKYTPSNDSIFSLSLDSLTYVCRIIKMEVARFIELEEKSNPIRLNIELYFKLRSMPIRVETLNISDDQYINCGVWEVIKSLPLFLKYTLRDLDFGLFDRIIRFFRYGAVKSFLYSDMTSHQILVDVGCGRQAFLGWKVPATSKYYGIDLDVPEVTIKNVALKKGSDKDIIRILGQKKVDKIFALALVEHLQEPDIFLRNAWRILKNNGLLIITTPPPNSKPILELISKMKLIDKREIEEHKFYFTPDSIVKLLNDERFEIVFKRSFLLGFNNLYVAKKVYEGRLNRQFLK